MSKYEVKLSFEATIVVEGEDNADAISNAIEKARLDYGSEVADYGQFQIEEGKDNE